MTAIDNNGQLYFIFEQCTIQELKESFYLYLYLQTKIRYERRKSSTFSYEFAPYGKQISYIQDLLLQKGMTTIELIDFVDVTANRVLRIINLEEIQNA